MILHKKEKKYKEVLSLQKEESNLWSQIHKIKPIQLDKPIKHGYVRYLKLRSEIFNRGDYSIIKEVIDFLGIRNVYYKDKSFKPKDNVELHSFVKTVTDPIFDCYYSEAHRQKDLDNIKKYKKYLSYCSIYACDCEDRKPYSKAFATKLVPHYIFRFPWMLEEVTKEHFLTHYTPVNGELESKMKEINNRFNRDYLYPVLYGRRYHRDRWHERREINSLIKKQSFKFSKNRIYHCNDFNELE